MQNKPIKVDRQVLTSADKAVCAGQAHREQQRERGGESEREKECNQKRRRLHKESNLQQRNIHRVDKNNSTLPAINFKIDPTYNNPTQEEEEKEEEAVAKEA